MPAIRTFLCTVSLGWLLFAGADALAEEPQSVQAIWKDQEISFYYQSFNTFYSCTSLESKVERVLRALGAKDPKARVRSAECHTGIPRMPRVTVEVTSPVEATPEALAERDEGKSTRELAARVRGEREQDAARADQFEAHWRRVSFSDRELDLQPGDCDLIEELRRKLLPHLAVRIVADEIRCSSNQLTIGRPQLEVEALIAAPTPDDAIR